MKVGFVQTSPKLFDVEGNIERALKLASRIDAEILVLPELFNTGYNFKDALEVQSVAEEIRKSYTIGRVTDYSRSRDVCVVGGFAERKGGKFFNSAFVVDKKLIGVYRKVHLFNTEKRFFTPGSKFNVFNVRGIKLGVMICFDWFYPEAMRTLALKGADVIAHPANLVLPYCPEVMRTRCLENRVYAVTADRVGVERGLKFIGRSQVVTPKGEIIYRASSNKQEVKMFKINPRESRNKKLDKYNDIFSDRRNKTYCI
jgi:predicted amidohydrolase